MWGMSPIKQSVSGSSQLALRALEIAKTQMGITEEPHGSNWGDDVEKYLASVGLNFPAYWCAAFAYWSFNEAAKEQNIANPLYKTASVLEHLHHSKATIILHNPLPGDIFILEFPSGHHTGLVDTVDMSLKTYTTCEGNSDANGSRTGGEVCSNGRQIRSAKAFLRY